MTPLPATALAVNVVLLPLQIALGAAVGATVGLAFTVTVVEAVALQPLASVTVTAYTPLIDVVEPVILGFDVVLA